MAKSITFMKKALVGFVFKLQYASKHLEENCHPDSLLILAGLDPALPKPKITYFGESCSCLM
jgi:hypothetical protein